MAKASAFWTVANYRAVHGLFACTGILGNHESPLRPKRFVTRKVIHPVALLALDHESHLTLGNLAIERDWGWAPEFVEAIALLLEQPSADDYMIATNQLGWRAKAHMCEVVSGMLEAEMAGIQEDRNEP